MGYTEAVLEVLIRDFKANIVLIHWDNKKLSDHEISGLCQKTINRSSIDLRGVLGILNDFSPDLIFVSGWMDKMYLSVARAAKVKGITVVAGMDTPWKGGLKQYISSIFLRKYWKKHFDYFWVPGNRQFQYVSRLGFKDQYLLNLYSCNLGLFNESWELSKDSKSRAYPHQLLFVGRLVKRKGIDLLIKQFIKIKEEFRSDWRLVIAGNGPLENMIPEIPEVRFTGFMNQNDLAKLMESSGAFCLPSHWEPWGVVIHESAAAGLPMILSDACGASETFLEEGVNGFTFNSRNEKDMREKLLELMGLSDEELFNMGENSNRLSKKITPEKSARTLLSVLE